MSRSATHRASDGSTFRIRDFELDDYDAVRTLWDEVLPSNETRAPVRSYCIETPSSAPRSQNTTAAAA